MTAAGSAEVAFRLEDSFLTPGTGSWIQPGMNISVGDLSIENNRTRNRQPDDTTPDGSRVGNFTASATVSWDLTDANWHDLLPLSSSSLSGQGGAAPTAEWYFAVDALDDTGAQFSEALTLAGGAVTDATVQYQEGQPIRIDVTVQFGGLSSNSPTSITQPSNADVFTHHGTDVSVGTLGQTGLQSATLSLSNLARRQEQAGRQSLRMVEAAAEPSFSTDAIFTENDQLLSALGGSTTSVADVVSGEASGEFAVSNGNGTTITYSLSELDPQSYSWAALVDGDTDLTEPVDYHVADVSVSTS